ncbi:MAG: ROK family protein [Clostridium sp.]|uniref:ROK family protein n=1 Tax=Clostridium sp. TaxID=1506 RepID=UPI003EE46116
MRKILAFDIGGTNTKYGIVNEMGDILEKGKEKTKAENEDVFIESLTNIIEKYKESIEGVAISMPGFINAEKGIPEVCYAINCMEKKSITEILKEKTGLKVTVENDGKCAALAEKFNGNAKECNDFICLTFGTGVGGGIFLNGKIIRGNSFRAGELGFMVCEGLTDKGGQGMLSTTASTLSLVNMYKEYKNIDMDIEVNGEEVFIEAEKNKEVQAILKKWYKSISIGIMNLSATLNPEKILLGGGVSDREDFISNILESLKEIKWWKDVSCNIELCKHRSDAGLIGATYNYLY